MAAELHVIHDGYANEQGVASSVVLVRDGDQVVVVDPGMVADRRLILGPLEAAGVRPEDVTDVVISHHHPDHTWHVGLFPEARLHDVGAVYRRDQWDDQPAEGRAVSPSVTLVETPGHTPQDISTLVTTDDGLVVCAHLWWHADGPAQDPRATDLDALRAGRRRILELDPVTVVPGHGPAFRPGPGTPH
jgi:glyoxylase-like metal-dependent hydrolase (beta-lactamase superfamily II)